MRRTESLASLTLAALLAVGCAVQDDPSLNRYAPAGGDPTLLEHADSAVTLLEREIDALDARMENALY